MADDRALVYDFVAQLDRFGDEVEDGAGKVLRTAASTTAEAIIVGNAFGPGIPVDTGFARASLVVGVNAPGTGLTQRPYVRRSLRAPGTVVFPALPDLSPVGTAVLGDTVFITTGAEYPQYLEFEPKRRRFGPNKGGSTEFLDPITARFDDIVDDAADRVGYGAVR